MGREEFVAYVELFLDMTGKAVKYRNGWTSRLPSQISAAMIQQVLDHMVQEAPWMARYIWMATPGTGT